MWVYPKMIAHRGGGSLVPENTLAGFKCARQMGFSAVEFDVMLTKDHVPVVIHDDKLGRTVLGKGAVAETLSHDLFQLDAGSWFASAYRGCRVPSLEKVCLFCMFYDIGMNIEIKPSDGLATETAHKIVEVIKRLCARYAFKRGPRILFSSFSLPALQAVKDKMPEIPRAVLYKNMPFNGLDIAQKLGAMAIHTHHRYMTKKQVRLIKQEGYAVACYTVNDVTRARTLWDWGVDACFTDALSQFSLLKTDLVG